MGAALAIRDDLPPAALRRRARHEPRDAVVRYNEEGIAGLHDRPKPGRPERLSEAEQAALAARVFAEPDPERDGTAAWTRADLGRWLEERFGKAFHPSSLSRVLRRPGLSRQKVRPVHPEADPKAQERFRERGCATGTVKLSSKGTGKRRSSLELRAY